MRPSKKPKFTLIFVKDLCYSSNRLLSIYRPTVNQEQLPTQDLTCNQTIATKIIN